jgi:hypothetical protein
VNTLAELTFDFLWLLMFSGEDVIDPRCSEQWLECLPDYFAKMTAAERMALTKAAENARDRLLAEPDEHGYTPRKLVTEQQRQFLKAMTSGDFFAQFD